MLALWGGCLWMSVVFFFKLPQLFLSLQGVLSLVSFVRTPKPTRLWGPLMVWGAMASGLVLYTLVFAQDPIASLKKASGVLAVFLSCALVYSIPRPSSFCPRPQTLVFLLMGTTLSLALQFFCGALLTHTLNGLIPFGDGTLCPLPRTLKTHLTLLSLGYWCMLAPCIHSRYPHDIWCKRGMGIIYGLLILLSLKMKALTVCVGLLGGAAVGGACFLFPRFPLKTVGLCAGVSCVVSPWVMATFKSAFTPLFTLFPGLFSTFDQRLQHWQDLISDLAQRPFFGGGLGYSRSVSQAQEFGPLMFPHNAPLELLLDVGVVGVLIGVGGLWVGLRKLDALKNPARRSAVAACATFVFVINQTSYSVTTTWWLSAVCLGFCWLSMISLPSPALMPQAFEEGSS